MYYRGAAAAIVVYDITREVRNPSVGAVRLQADICFRSQSTFRTLQKWVQELNAMGPKAMVIAIAGNKSGLS